MKEPTTEAGRRLLVQWDEQTRLSPASRTMRSAIRRELDGAILAIEDEARAPLVAALDRLNRLIVSYADLTHEVVWNGGDWRDIAKEWSGVVDEARAALSREDRPHEHGPLTWEEGDTGHIAGWTCDVCGARNVSTRP